MLFMLATILWIGVLVISIYNSVKSKEPKQEPQKQINRNKMVESIILEYINKNGGETSLEGLEEEFIEIFKEQLKQTVWVMVHDGDVIVGIDPNTSQEYIKLNPRGISHVN